MADDTQKDMNQGEDEEAQIQPRSITPRLTRPLLSSGLSQRRFIISRQRNAHETGRRLGESKPKVCRFFFSPNGCRHGESCRHSHVLPPSAFRRKGRGGGRARRGRGRRKDPGSCRRDQLPKKSRGQRSRRRRQPDSSPGRRARRGQRRGRRGQHRGQGRHRYRPDEFFCQRGVFCQSAGCKFGHKRPCSSFPNCRFGDSCRFGHYVRCTFDPQCTKRLCRFFHPSRYFLFVHAMGSGLCPRAPSGGSWLEYWEKNRGSLISPFEKADEKVPMRGSLLLMLRQEEASWAVEGENVYLVPTPCADGLSSKVFDLPENSLLRLPGTDRPNGLFCEFSPSEIFEERVEKTRAELLSRLVGQMHRPIRSETFSIQSLCLDWVRIQENRQGGEKEEEGETCAIVSLYEEWWSDPLEISPQLLFCESFDPLPLPHRSLSITGSDLSESGQFEWDCLSSCFPKARSLILQYVKLTSEETVSLFSEKFFPKLEALTIQGCSPEFLPLFTEDCLSRLKLRLLRIVDSSTDSSGFEWKDEFLKSSQEILTQLVLQKVKFRAPFFLGFPHLVGLTLSRCHGLSEESLCCLSRCEDLRYVSIENCSGLESSCGDSLRFRTGLLNSCGLFFACDAQEELVEREKAVLALLQKLPPETSLPSWFRCRSFGALYAGLSLMHQKSPEFDPLRILQFALNKRSQSRSSAPADPRGGKDKLPPVSPVSGHQVPFDIVPSASIAYLDRVEDSIPVAHVKVRGCLFSTSPEARSREVVLVAQPADKWCLRCASKPERVEIFRLGQFFRQREFLTRDSRVFRKRIEFVTKDEFKHFFSLEELWEEDDPNGLYAVVARVREDGFCFFVMKTEDRLFDVSMVWTAHQLFLTRGRYVLSEAGGEFSCNPDLSPDREIFSLQKAADSFGMDWDDFSFRSWEYFDKEDGEEIRDHVSQLLRSDHEGVFVIEVDYDDHPPRFFACRPDADGKGEIAFWTFPFFSHHQSEGAFLKFFSPPRSCDVKSYELKLLLNVLKRKEEGEEAEGEEDPSSDDDSGEESDSSRGEEHGSEDGDAGDDPSEDSDGKGSDGEQNEGDGCDEEEHGSDEDDEEEGEVRSSELAHLQPVIALVAEYHFLLTHYLHRMLKGPEIAVIGTEYFGFDQIKERMCVPGTTDFLFVGDDAFRNLVASVPSHIEFNVSIFPKDEERVFIWDYCQGRGKKISSLIIPCIQFEIAEWSDKQLREGVSALLVACEEIASGLVNKGLLFDVKDKQRNLERSGSGACVHRDTVRSAGRALRRLRPSFPQLLSQFENLSRQLELIVNKTLRQDLQLGPQKAMVEMLLCSKYRVDNVVLVYCVQGIFAICDGSLFLRKDLTPDSCAEAVMSENPKKGAGQVGRYFFYRWFEEYRLEACGPMVGVDFNEKRLELKARARIEGSENEDFPPAPAIPYVHYQSTGRIDPLDLKQHKTWEYFCFHLQRARGRSTPTDRRAEARKEMEKALTSWYTLRLSNQEDKVWLANCAYGGSILKNVCEDVCQKRRDLALFSSSSDGVMERSMGDEQRRIQLFYRDEKKYAERMITRPVLKMATGLVKQVLILNSDDELEEEEEGSFEKSFENPPLCPFEQEAEEEGEEFVRS